MPKLGVIVGRFQVPILHEGHMSLINRAVSECDRVLIVIGTTDAIYTKRNPRRISIIGLDHIGKLGGCTVEGNFLKPESRELMQLASDIASQEYRDLYGFSPVYVSQFNRGLETANRFGNETIIPQPSDFKNSSNMYED